MYALILIIYTQSAMSLTPQIDRLEISPRIESEKTCETAGKRLSGPLMAETDPARQYTWQDYQCVLLK